MKLCSALYATVLLPVNCSFHSFTPACNVLLEAWSNHVAKLWYYSVDKKNQLDVTFCILYLSSNSCSTCFGQPYAHHQDLTTA